MRNATCAEHKLKPVSQLLVVSEQLVNNQPAEPVSRAPDAVAVTSRVLSLLGNNGDVFHITFVYE